jgi:Uma2 family endonuclease
MSSLPHAVVTWTEFLRLPERPESGMRYELHDGEVIVVPPPRPLHRKVQKRLESLLEALAGKRGVVEKESPYRPAPNLQYWIADLAYIPQADWQALPPDRDPIYAPPLIVEVLSSSNTQLKVDRQRTIAMSAGTKEFWVVDPERKTVRVTTLKDTHLYTEIDAIPVRVLGRKAIAAKRIFSV